MIKILIAVGGTGGHIYPALALADEMKAEATICFAGGKLLQNPYFDKEAYPFKEISSASLQSKNPFKLFRDGLKILKGVRESIRLIKDFQPDIVLGFGSFYTFPLLLAAAWTKTPLILHEANSIPGKVNRLMSRFAKTTAIHFPFAAEKLRGNASLVKMPLRDGFSPSAKGKEEALAYYGLDANVQTLLIFGGSQGAKRINQLVSEAIELTKNRSFQVIHITGKYHEGVQEVYARLGVRACVKEFENRMDLAWQVADLMISRAGAGTIAEQIAFEVPGILIPYPFATDQHQDKNADFMVDPVGGAVKYAEKELSAAMLANAIDHFDAKELQQKKENILYYKQRQVSKTLSQLIRGGYG